MAPFDQPILCSFLFCFSCVDNTQPSCHFEQQPALSHWPLWSQYYNHYCAPWQQCCFRPHSIQPNPDPFVPFSVPGPYQPTTPSPCCFCAMMLLPLPTGDIPIQLFPQQPTTTCLSHNSWSITHPIITVNSQHTNTTVAACTDVKKSNGGCITTVKQMHRLHDAGLIRSMCPLPHWMSLLPSTTSQQWRNPSPTHCQSCCLWWVGTASNSAPLSKFYSIHS